jgi:hypothetical protein
MVDHDGSPRHKHLRSAFYLSVEVESKLALRASKSRYQPVATSVLGMMNEGRDGIGLPTPLS